MNSGFGTDDLFDNAWNSNKNEISNFGIGSSIYGPTSSFLDSPDAPEAHSGHEESSIADLSLKIPDSYKAIYDHLKPLVNSASDLEAAVFSPLVENDHFLSFQSSRIMDIVYEHDLLPPNDEKNFFQILGLIALELNTAGSGDFVTLQFKLNSYLPDLPSDVISLLTSDSASKYETLKPASGLDPLSAQLASSSISDTNEADNMLADHSNLLIDPDATLPESTHVNDYPYIMRYMSDIRDKFKPLLGSADTVSIKEVPEKEGLVFKHINYAITHELKLGLHSPSGPKKVVRRYSDFVWLLEFLLKKYPFRIIPGLPPKKFTGMFSTMILFSLTTN